jgi:hypothetical protein
MARMRTARFYPAGRHHGRVTSAHQDPPAEGAALDDPADAAALAGHATALADAVAGALPGWVRRSVEGVLAAQGIPLDAGLRADVDRAVAEATAEGDSRVRTLLATDVDRQGANPLAVLRSLVRHPTAVLRSAGAKPVPRDEFRERSFPDDVYDLAPASFADVDPSLHEPGSCGARPRPTSTWPAAAGRASAR